MNNTKKSLPFAPLLMLLMLACGLNSDPKQISHSEFLQTHRYAIGQTTIELIDKERQRPIKTEIWYPTMDTTKENITANYPFVLPPTSKDAAIIPNQLPLILFSHGTGGNRISQFWLASELVGNGYIVASVNHFGNTLDNKIPENFVKIWDRPIDISYLLDHLLESPKWGASIDTTKIGMAGFSLGGYTGIALAGAVTDYQLLKQFANSEQGQSEFILPELGDIRHLITNELVAKGNTAYDTLKDNRISAFVLMAPALGQAFNSAEQFQLINKPMLFIGAENDERTPVQTNAKHYHQLIQHSTYIELPGKIGHYIFMNEAENGLKRNAPLIFKDDVSVNRKEEHKRISTIVNGFFDHPSKNNN